MSQDPISTSRFGKIYLKDYRPPAYLVPTIELDCELGRAHTRIHAKLEITRNTSTPQSAPLILDGRNLKIEAVAIDGTRLASDQYHQETERLLIPNVPSHFVLEIYTSCSPQDNKSGEGLYCSGTHLCTQMEPEGFRRLTYFPDRPDVLSLYTVRITAEQAAFPVLLSNGNLIEKGQLENGRHFVVWEDPFPKPCYLFALVAGKLAVVPDSFTTCSGRQVEIRFYVDPGSESRCTHAIESLKQAMRWDEEVFGLEYDLDCYIVVAVDSFNSGAMENKGLNIFNSQLVLADVATATDANFTAIQSTIAHEYFHNYTGNRVTLRDWFQLTLKEGLTVLRDQEFSADHNSPPWRRIADVRFLHEFQFPEDAGGNAHPIQPKAYSEINNFYTRTVYEKGAEVIRMLLQLVGRSQFIASVQRYLREHDGQAATVDEFIQSFEKQTHRDLKQFRRWYDQPGTPLLQITGNWEPSTQTYTLLVQQSNPRFPDQAPLHIPLSIGLLNQQGEEFPLQNNVLEVKEQTQEFTFSGINEQPVPSLLRDFSAPVNIDYSYNVADLELLIQHDQNSFNRYAAAQQLAIKTIAAYQEHDAGGIQILTGALGRAYAKVIQDQDVEPGIASEIISLPNLEPIAARRYPLDYPQAFEAREEVYNCLIKQIKSAIQGCFELLNEQLQGPYTLDPRDIGRRALRNACLRYLAVDPSKIHSDLVSRQYHQSNNMTDQFAALQLMAYLDLPEKEVALKQFAERWSGNHLVMLKWFAVQAAAPVDGVLEIITRLESHPEFDKQNPNCLRAIYRNFGRNLSQFHHRSGQGYSFLVDRILEIDRFNSHIAAGLVSLFERGANLCQPQQDLLYQELQRLLNCSTTSKGVTEMVANIIKQIDQE